MLFHQSDNFFLQTFFLNTRQIDYESEFVYDVSLQGETELNGEIKSIVPAQQKKYRHK